MSASHALQSTSTGWRNPESRLSEPHYLGAQTTQSIAHNRMYGGVPRQRLWHRFEVVI